MTQQQHSHQNPSGERPKDPVDPQSADAAVAARKAQIAEAWKVYDKGQYLDALGAIESLLKEDMPTDQRQELYALQAWCHYRRSEWEQSLQSCTLADSHQRALECELYIRSYVPDYRDEARIEAIQTTIGSTINGANAFLIRARTADPVPYEQVEAILARFTEAPADTPTVFYANLLHNGGRVFLDRSRSGADLDRAEALIRRAIQSYGDSSENLHHKGAAYFWLSTTYEKREDFAGAAREAAKSEECWRLQVEGNAQSSAHIEKYDNAKKRTAEMIRRAGI
jgi:hypothetical protein